MRRYNCLYGFILCGLVVLNSSAEITREQIWNKNNSYVVPWKDMSVEYKTFALEQYWEEIQYSLANMGKSFKDVNAEKVNSMFYERDVGYITYGLVAGKYASYGDYEKAAYYYHKDDLQATKCSRESARIKPECWGGAPGEWTDLLLPVINVYERHNDYKGALPYYRESLRATLYRFKGKTLEEKLVNLKSEIGDDDEGWKGTIELGNRWERAKKLAKTEKPIPMDPAVQNHEWFYSDKTEKVLKALKYYNQHNVKFMIEKAVKHKNPVVAKKAKEYLENWESRPAEEMKSEQTRGDKK